MYTSPSYDGVIYVAMPALKGLRQGKYLWFKLEGSGTPRSVNARIVPSSVRKLAYNQFWERRKG